MDGFARARTITQYLAPNRAAHQDGYVTIMTSLLLIPMMIFAAFAVDVGGWYAAGHETQAAADAAALAGVPFLPNESEAEQIALDTAAKNGYPDQPGCDGAVAECNPTMFPQVIVDRVAPGTLEVNIFTEGDVFFGRVVMDPIPIHRYAVAQNAKPLVMGNPTSALGSGTEESAGVQSNFFLRAMAECEPRSTGDFIGAGGGCPNRNPNYREEGHTFIVEVPTAGSYTVQARTTCAEFRGDQANASMRFRFFDSDGTPYDDSDNVQVPPLAETVVPRPPTSICPLDGSGWTPDNDPAPWIDIASVYTPGRYILQAKNPEQRQKVRSLYSLRVVPSGGSTTCSRIGSSGTSGCPNIIPKDYLTVFTASGMFPGGDATRAELFLAEVSDIHAGETMLVELFDPADGIDYLRFVDPHGNYANVSWYGIDCRRYSYRCDRADIGSPTARVSQTCGGISCIKQAGGISFQDRTILIEIPLDSDYECARPAGQPVDCWWKVEYFDEDGRMFETTTWGVNVTGNPVSLIE